MGIGEVLRDEQLSFPFWLVSLILVAQQLSGINAVFFYSTGFFQAAGLSNPIVGTLLASSLNMLAILGSVPLMEVAHPSPSASPKPSPHR